MAKVNASQIDKKDLESMEQNLLVSLSKPMKMSQEIKDSMVSITRAEARFLVDSFYAAQSGRIIACNRIRSIEQGYDNVLEKDELGNAVSSYTRKEDVKYLESLLKSGISKSPQTLIWLAANRSNEEKELEKALKLFALNDPVGRWMMANMGIGPVISAGLLAYLSLEGVNSMNQFWTYAGLNDNNRKWLKKAGAEKAIEEWLNILEEKGIKLIKNNVSDEALTHLVALPVLGRRTFDAVKKGGTDRKKKNEPVTVDRLQAYLAMPPYNIELKVLCWKIGESFIKVINKEKSLYGKIMKERRVYETIKNNNGDYADQAAYALATKNFSKPDVIKVYKSGKLTEGHIMSRIKRHAVKIFIGHVFEAMYYIEKGIEPPNPYCMEYQGHKDRIYPEVDYHKYR